MNKEVMIRKYKIDDELNRIKELMRIYNEINCCKSIFKKEESINAINEIINYCEQEQKKFRELSIESIKMHFEFRKCCEHDILKEIDNVENIYYECTICHRKFLKNEIDFDCFILSQEFNSYLVHEIIKNYLKSDKDMYDVIQEFLESIYEKNEIKVYRRVK